MTQIAELKKERAERIRSFIESNPNLSKKEYAEKLDVSIFIVSGVLGAINKKEKNKSLPLSKVKIQNFIEENIIKLSREDIMKALQIDIYCYRANLASISKKLNKTNKKPTKIVGEFVHTKSVKKEVMYRNPIIEKLQQSSLKNGTVLSLPAEKFITEKRIFDEVSKKFNFIGVEFNNDNFYSLLTNLAKDRFKMVVYPSDLASVLATMQENSLSHLLADYCGQLHTYQAEIVDAVQRNLVKVDGIITITINKRITGAENHKFYDEMIGLNDTSMYGDVCKVELAFKIFLERLCGFNYKLETYLDYQSGETKSANMMLGIIRRIK